MKRLLGLIGFVVGVAALAGCGKPDTLGGTTTTSPRTRAFCHCAAHRAGHWTVGLVAIPSQGMKKLLSPSSRTCAVGCQRTSGGTGCLEPVGSEVSVHARPKTLMATAEGQPRAVDY